MELHWPAREVIRPLVLFTLFGGVVALSRSTGECFIMGDRLLYPCWELQLDAIYRAPIWYAAVVGAVWLILRISRHPFSIKQLCIASGGAIAVCIPGALTAWGAHLLRLAWIVPLILWALTITISISVIYRHLSRYASSARTIFACLLLLGTTASAMETANGSIPQALHKRIETRPDGLLAWAAARLNDATAHISIPIPREWIGLRYWISQYWISQPILWHNPFGLSYRFELVNGWHGLTDAIYPTFVRLSMQQAPSGYRIASATYALGGLGQTSNRIDPSGSAVDLVKTPFDKTEISRRQELVVKTVVVESMDGTQLSVPVHLKTTVTFHRPIRDDNAMYHILSGLRELEDEHPTIPDDDLDLSARIRLFLGKDGPCPTTHELRSFTNKYSRIASFVRNGLWNEETRFSPFAGKEERLRWRDYSFLGTLAIAEGLLASNEGRLSKGVNAAVDTLRLGAVVRSANPGISHSVLSHIIFDDATNLLLHLIDLNTGRPLPTSPPFVAWQMSRHIRYERHWPEVAIKDAMDLAEEYRLLVRQHIWISPIHSLMQVFGSEIQELSPSLLTASENRVSVKYELLRAYFLVDAFQTALGRYPESLEEAADLPGTDPPQDFYSGHAISYVHSGDEFRVYSFGPDWDGDGGMTNCEKWDNISIAVCNGDWVLGSISR